MQRSFFHDLNELVKRNQNSGDDSDVNNSYVDFSLKLISNININSVEEAFLYFSAFNYLNFATKKQRSIGYAFKGILQDVVIDCLNNRVSKLRFYLSRDNTSEVLYCLFDEEFVFSFHSPSITDGSLVRYLKGCKCIDFDGVRKQRCPNIILNAAIKLNRGESRQQNITPQRNTYQNTSNTYSRTNSSGNGNFKINCSINLYELDDIRRDFQLDKLSKDRTLTENISVVLSTLYFYLDLINSGSVPFHIKKEMFRETITQSFSVLESIEVYVGSRIVATNKLKWKGKKKPSEKDLQIWYIELCQKTYPMDKPEQKMYKEYKELRHNVHLCKAQQILNDSYYTEQTVEKWFKFMEQYLTYIANSL